MSEGDSFWKTLPGILTGAAALIGAIAGLTTALYTAGIIGHTRHGSTGSSASTGSKGQGAARSTVTPPAPGTGPGRSDNPAQPPSKTRILAIDATGVSGSELRLDVDYQYAGDLGSDEARVVVSAQGAGGALVQGLVIPPPIVTKGAGRVPLQIRAERPGTFRIESLQICLVGVVEVSMKARRACDSFPLRRTLVGAPTPLRRPTPAR